MVSEFEQTPLNRVKRVPKNASYDRETVFAVIDAAWIGHLSFLDPSTQSPVLIPMFHARDQEELIFHGARSSRLIKLLGSGQRFSVGFTLVDGLVLAKSTFHHSMNYRSAVIYGSGRVVETEDERWDSFRILTEKAMPGRWDDARQPSSKELAATEVVRLKIDSASAKIRTGPPVDEPNDLRLPVWSGIVPLKETADEPQADKHSKELPVPDYVENFLRLFNRTGQ